MLKRLLLIALFAFALRMVLIVQTAQVPFARHLVGDARGYYEWAKTISGGNWIGTEPFYQAPLYPYVLAVIFKTVGDSIFTIRIVQAVLGAIACAALAAAAANWFDRRTGTLTGFLLAIYSPAIFYDTIIQKAALDGLLICLMLWGMSLPRPARYRIGWFQTVSLGVLGAFLCLNRENALIWLPLLFLWIVQRVHSLPLPRRHEVEALPRRELPNAPSTKVSQHGTIGRRAAVATMFLLAVGAVLTPVGLRNRALGGAWSFTTFQAGPNFYIGNHRGADGRYVPLVRGHETPEFERADATRLAEAAAGRSLAPREVSDFWMARAWHDIQADAIAWMGLMARKTAMVFNRYEVADAESIVVYVDSSMLLAGLAPVVHFGTLAPLALVGFIAARRQWRQWWILPAMIVTMGAAVATFYVLGRYRYPLVPLAIPFAARGILALWDACRLRGMAHARVAMPSQAAGGSPIGASSIPPYQGGMEGGRCPLRGPVGRLAGVAPWLRGLLGLIALLLISALFFNWPLHDQHRLDALARMNAGVALAQMGEVPAALPWFERAVADHPDSPEANNNFAQALATTGDFARAAVHYQRALTADPGLVGVHYNLAVALERLGRIDEAVAHYERALQRDPSDSDARSALSRVRTTPQNDAP